MCLQGEVLHQRANVGGQEEETRAQSSKHLFINRIILSMRETGPSSLYIEFIFKLSA